MKRKLIPILLTAMLGITAGCSGNECYDNHSALPLAAFFSSSTMQPVTLQLVEIYGIGAPGDSLLYDPQALKQAYLPFRIWQDTTQYVFSYLDIVEDDGSVPKDTVTFIYKPKEWFVSPACGAMYFYDMEKAEHTSFLIDSIYFNDVITNENIANIKIFFKDR